MHADADVVGEYGVHSDQSRRFAELFDRTASISPLSDVHHTRGRDGGEQGEGGGGNGGGAATGHGDETPGLWLCGHFCAKAFLCMAADLARPEGKDKTMLFWQTKSRVQPRGAVDEWDRMRQMPPAVRQWANKGVAESALRPGSVDTESGCSADYRELTTVVA